VGIDVVTGASGHLGANLVRALLARGRRVRVVERRRDRALEGLEVDRVVADVCDAAGMVEAIAGAERVFNLAARISTRDTEVPEVRAVNVDGVRNVVEACLRHRVKRLVHFSSIHAFSVHPEDSVVDERRPLCDEPGAGFYDRTKRDGQRIVETAVRERGLPAVVVHPTGVLGPHDYRPSKMGGVLLDFFRGGLPIVPDGGFDWVDVRDVAEGAIAAAERGVVGERYLLSNEWVSMRELARIAEGVSGRRGLRVAVPLAVLRAAVPLARLWGRATDGEPRVTHYAIRTFRYHQRISNEKARAELGYAPRPIRATVEDTYGFFRSAGML